MNTSYDFNSTPKMIDQSKYMESLMDFSTPMSTIPNQRITTKILSDTNTTILNKLLQKFQEHQTNFSQTQIHLNLLDNHLREITIVLQQLQTSFDQHSSLKTTTDQLEVRLLQMSTKREQIRNVINHFHQSPTINQTLDEIIHQISPYKSKSTDYTDLINAIKLSFNQKTNLLEHFEHEKHRTMNSHFKIQQHEQILLQLIEKLLEQQKTNEKFIQITTLSKPECEQHTKQLNEFNKLHEEYQFLQNENHQFKQMVKENIKSLYYFINQTTE